jgi:hypothetical protein
MAFPYFPLHKRTLLLVILGEAILLAIVVFINTQMLYDKPAAMTAPRHILWGAFLGDVSKNPSLVTQFDNLTNATSDIIAVFSDLTPGGFPDYAQSAIGAQNKILLWFLEPQHSLDDINSGAYDNLFKKYASSSAAYGYPIILAPFAEFNLNEAPWQYSLNGNTPEKFVQAWRRVHGFFAGVTNVTFALAYNNQNIPDDGKNNFKDYYPGDDYVNFVAVDGFNFGTSTEDSQNFNQIFDPIMPTLESFKKPIILTSIGSLSYPQKAHWIRFGLDAYLKEHPNIVGWVYFNFNDVALNRDWSIDTDPASLATFRFVVKKN